MRRAIAFALPYDDMFKAALFGRGTPLFGAEWVDRQKTDHQRLSVPAADQARPRQGQGISESRRHAGRFFDHFQFSTSGQASTAEPMAALVKESLGKIGVKVDIQKLPDAQMSTQINEKKLPFFTEGIVAWFPTPDYFYRNFYIGNQRWNYASVDNKELTAIAQGSAF